MRKPRDFYGFPKDLEILAPFGKPKRAVVQHVEDADSLLLLVDDEHEGYSLLMIRLQGLFMPDTRGQYRTPESLIAAKDAYAKMLELCGPGEYCVVRTVGKSFDRWVGRVTLAGGRDLTTEMLNWWDEYRAERPYLRLRRYEGAGAENVEKYLTPGAPAQDNGIVLPATKGATVAESI